ncbi:MAG: hypothetical protein H8D23_07840 [Candidatus Brocadiales bacterium]|nr:hypothetical protein [Candidatus Brocadiales bacterium]
MVKRKTKPRPKIIKKEFKCWCGEKFEVTKKESLNLLDNFELFCSYKCVLSYIAQCDTKAPTIPVNPPKVGLDFNQYDVVTKAFYRSWYEVWLARCFKKHKVKFKYEPHSFFFDGHYYTPDFYLPDKEIYIEVKGLWRRGSKTKVRKLAEKATLILLPSYFQKCLRKFKRQDDLVK